MTQVKELHLGKTLEDLDKRTVIPDVRTKKMQILLESARKLFKEAEKYYLDGDEELAYVFYMKYFNLLSCIHKKPDYQLHKQSVKQMLGGNSSHTGTMDKLELLSKSLSSRYSKLTAVTEHSNDMPFSPNGRQRTYNELSAAEKFDRLKAADASEKLEASFKSQSLISCAELFKRTQENDVLIMDCRSSKDYACSHLTYAWAFNVPEEHIIAGMSAGKLQDKLDNTGRVMWSARSVKNQVVLMDWNSKDENPAPNSPIAILQNILQNWDPDVIYRAPIKILEGGYEYFIMMYPTLCTNPSVQAPQPDENCIELIDDIEYPSIHDITMKDDIENSWKANSMSPSRNAAADVTASTSLSVIERPPSIDRSSKLAALKTYDQQKQKPIVEILEEQKDLLERAHENDVELERAAKKWQTIFERSKSKTNIDLTNSEQELLYNLMQLESTAEDYKVENNRLRDELDKYKRLEVQQQQQEQLSPKEVVNLEETTKHIESKLQERQKLDEQHERERRQREHQLALARENKRHMKPPIIEDEEISQPKIPQFDRSVKPQIQTAAISPTSLPIASFRMERHRDFSPVRGGAMGRGLTGLKNLGNTCYMNSIIQCLSNTQQLTEYCLTDKYKNYISRSNKTKGHIVEEVAALIKVLWNGNFKCVASKDLRYVMGQYQQIFRGIEQQDSHEFLTILMDWLHSDLQTLHVPEKTRDNITASERAWLEFTKAKESLILHLFYGQIKSTVKCVECNKESATYESFSNLSLELPSNASHLSQCMDMYFSGELIHGWNCPSCQRKRDAVKKLDISKLPPVLVVHLKRFYADTDIIGNSYRKKQDYVRFPLENLDMTPYIAKSESRAVTPKTYQLYGVSNHYGSMESGHYTAFCKSGNNGRWFKFDDQIVTPIDKSNVVSSAAYILFYTWLPPIQLPEPN